MIALYRFFSAKNRLLYVGISQNPFKREKQHRAAKNMRAVRYIEIEWFPSRTLAGEAERTAICRERPKWNAAHQQPRRVCRETPSAPYIAPQRPSPRARPAATPQPPARPREHFGPPAPYYSVGIAPTSVMASRNSGLEYDYADEEGTLRLALKVIRSGDLVFAHPEAALPNGFWDEVKAKGAYAVDQEMALRFAAAPPARMAS